jgi:hypothetical protein
MNVFGFAQKTRQSLNRVFGFASKTQLLFNRVFGFAQNAHIRQTKEETRFIRSE